MERKIGEIFEYNGEWYQAVEQTEKSCKACYFYSDEGCFVSTGLGRCRHYSRNDNKSVIFKKLEKVGEPHFIKDEIFEGGKVYVQNFKVYEDFEGHKPICNDYIIYDWKNRIITIKIKQGKEDMEDNRTIDQHSAECEQTINDVVQKCYTENKSTQVKNIEEKKLNLKPFDLEEAKAGKPVCTRDGRKVRIICFDRKDVRPIIALIKSDNDDEGVYYYYADGSNLDNYPSVFDLMMLSEKKKGWVNIYKSEDPIFLSKEEAELHKDDFGGYITTTKIEWEE